MASDEFLNKERSLPAIPRETMPDHLRTALEAMREQVERLSGKLDKASRALRVFDLDGDLLSAMLPAPSMPSLDSKPGAGGGRILKAPINLKWEHLVFAIKLTWTNVEPEYSHVEIWCSEGSANLDEAKLVGVSTAPAAEWHHYGVSMKTSHTYWIRAVGWDGGLSPWCPPQGQGGLVVPAPIDQTIEEILDMLIGQITENQLYQELQSRIDLIDGAGAGSVSARIQTEKNERVAADNVLTSLVNTMRTTVNGNTAALQQHASTLNGVQAQWFLKTDVNGHVAGFGLLNQGASSDFIVNANRFMVVMPGRQPKVPFVVGNIGGQTGVGIDGGLVVNGSIMARHLDANSVTADKINTGAIGTRHLGAESVDASKIKVGAVTADKIATGAITAQKLAANAITADMIKTGTLDANLIRENGITLDKILAGVVIASNGADFRGGAVSFVVPPCSAIMIFGSGGSPLGGAGKARGILYGGSSVFAMNSEYLGESQYGGLSFPSFRYVAGRGYTTVLEFRETQHGALTPSQGPDRGERVAYLAIK